MSRGPPVESRHDPSQAGPHRRAGCRDFRGRPRRRARAGLRKPQAGGAWRPRLHRRDAARQGLAQEPARGRRGAGRGPEPPAGRAALGRCARDRRAGLHQPAPQGRRQAGGGGRGGGGRRGLRPPAGAHRPGAGRVRLGQPDRPAARRPRPPGGARRRDLQPVRDPGLAGHPRVLLQRRRRPESRPWARARSCAPGASRPAIPSGRPIRTTRPARGSTTATTSPTSPPTSWPGRPSRPTTASSPPPAT